MDILTELQLGEYQLTWHMPLTKVKQSALGWEQALIDSVAQFADFLLRNPMNRDTPEIIALAFWFRGSHLQQLAVDAQQYGVARGGRVFHIAPANVDTVFMYSLLLSVLAGNQNIVRLSSRSGSVAWRLLEQLKQFNTNTKDACLTQFISIIEYNANQPKVTELLSCWSDLRVVWGGDKAIAAVSSIAPETCQVNFPDRFSIAVLQLSNSDNVRPLAQGFLTDVLAFNQQACSSPKAVYWIDTSRYLQQEFWDCVERLVVKSVHTLTTADKIEQLVLAQGYIMQGLVRPQHIDVNGTAKGPLEICQLGPLSRLPVNAISGSVLELHSGHGLVLETQITALSDLPQHPKLQTVVVSPSLGQHEWETLGAKRITTVGNALTFDTHWDGVDLLRLFIRLTPTSEIVENS
jgi:hypothetical protein